MWHAMFKLKSQDGYNYCGMGPDEFVDGMAKAREEAVAFLAELDGEITPLDDDACSEDSQRTLVLGESQ